MKEAINLTEGLRRAPDVLAAFVKSIDEERLDLRRGEGFWTVAEHVSHLAQVQPMLLERLERFRNEARPEFIPYIPGDGEEEPATPDRMVMVEALQQFAEFRGRQIGLLESVDNTFWEKVATHPEYRRYSGLILARHILMHDYWHMYRMEELWLTRDPYLTRLE